MTARRWLLALPIAITIAIGRARLDQLILPHPTCQNVFRNQEPTTTVKCNQGTDMYVIPDNFTSALIHAKVVILEIKGGSVRNTGAASLPTRSTLQTVQLEQLNLADASPRFPMNIFFVNVRSHLKKISLRSVKLLHLSSTDFEGFLLLEQIHLVAVQVNSLGASIFESVTSDASLHMLLDFQLSEGTIEFMDWSFLRPVAKRLTNLKMDKLHLSANMWHCSGDVFRLDRVSTVSLRNNNLTQIPHCLLRSLNPKALTSLFLHSSQTAFCPESIKCDCCDLSFLASWLRDAGLSRATRSITCGEQKVTFEKFPEQIIYQSDCQATTTLGPNTNATQLAHSPTTMKVASSSTDHSMISASVAHSSDAAHDASISSPGADGIVTTTAMEADKNTTTSMNGITQNGEPSTTSLTGIYPCATRSPPSASDSPSACPLIDIASSSFRLDASSFVQHPTTNQLHPANSYRPPTTNQTTNRKNYYTTHYP
ncbi:hypothetical protein BV898_06033 [Hypsibius exemplaris]|uniref:LRRCT domain-containing protein n=1 Tax=Hypsibius exemplaris TaxID=2072580 RepID=A0A1W0WXV0_HYPEX|nr:hypothetical protein BV898_06033 [Hypsibius exemplaris]